MAGEIPAPVSPDHDSTQTETPPNHEEVPMTEITQDAVDAARKEGRDEGYQQANARMTAVFASEHYAGRETYAAKLLGKQMAAEDIIDLLADYPVAKPEGGQQASREEQLQAAEEGGRKELRAQLDGDTNSGISMDDATSTSLTKAQEILRDQAAFTGRKLAK